jgi:hypothetical protein
MDVIHVDNTISHLHQLLSCDSGFAGCRRPRTGQRNGSRNDTRGVSISRSSKRTVVGKPIAFEAFAPTVKVVVAHPRFHAPGQ